VITERDELLELIAELVGRQSASTRAAILTKIEQWSAPADVKRLVRRAFRLARNGGNGVAH
jgi:hypothetical protein